MRSETIELRNIAKSMYVKSGFGEIKLSRKESGFLSSQRGTIKNRARLNSISQDILMLLRMANLTGLFSNLSFAKRIEVNESRASVHATYTIIFLKLP